MLRCPPCPGVLCERGPDTRAALPNSQYLQELASCGWELASCGWRWRFMAETVSFSQIQMCSYSWKRSSADSSDRQSFPGLLVWGKAWWSFMFKHSRCFQPVLWHSSLMWGGFILGHVETVVRRKGNTFPKKMARRWLWRTVFLFPEKLAAEYEEKPQK